MMSMAAMKHERPTRSTRARRDNDPDLVHYVCDGQYCTHVGSIRPGTLFESSNQSLITWVGAMQAFDADATITQVGCRAPCP
jgi:hypothetical protein